MERKIGEIFEHNGEWYQCVEFPFSESEYYCDGCSISAAECVDFICDPGARDDNKRVIFKKLEKVGEPYVAYGKVRQKYKLYIPLTITKGIIERDISCDDVHVIVDIEIKQNKEDMEENKFNLKPFDLQKAKEGKPVCTRDGRKARIICFDRIDSTGCNLTIVALIQVDETEVLQLYHDNGKCDAKADLDLMMLPEKKEGWVNVYKMKESTFGYITSYFDTEENAKEDKEQLTGYVATVKINWEE